MRRRESGAAGAAAEGCPACERTTQEANALRELLGLFVRGVHACVALLDREQTDPSMPKHRVLAVLHHRLAHLMTQTDPRKNR